MSKPNKLIVDMSKVFEAAQTYVMLSRVQSLEQLIIIDSVLPEKIYPSSQALEEPQKTSNRAVNQKMTENDNYFVSNSLNIRSLKKHLIDIVNEPNITKSDMRKIINIESEDNT